MLVDIHHHLLWGVDDGPQDPEASMAMLRAASEQGVGAIVCSSHDCPGERPLDRARYEANLALLRARAEAEGLDVRLIAGSEVLYSPDTLRALADGRVLTLDGGRCVLTEFYPDCPWPILRRAAEDLCRSGLRMVLAHAERCDALEDLSRLTLLRGEFGVRIQLNADTVLRTARPLRGQWARRVLREGLCDVVASDAHDLRARPCRLGAAYDLICKRYGTAEADRLCKRTPQELAAD